MLRQIESKEIEIDAIKCNFNHEFNKINFKKNNYEDSLKDYNEQNSNYEAMVDDYKNKEEKVQERLQEYNNNIEKLQKDAASFKSIISEIEIEYTNKKSLLNDENLMSVQLYNLIKKQSNIIQIKDRNIEEIQNLDVSSKRLESDIFTIDMRIPTLEEEKKGFVSLRNFKEAGRVSAELKQLSENKIRNQEKITENKEKIIELKTSIEEVNLTNNIRLL